MSVKTSVKSKAHGLPGYLLLIYSIGCLAMVFELSSLPHPEPQPEPIVWVEPERVDFAAIEGVAARKQAFFDYLLPLIEQQNQSLLRTRTLLLGMQKRLKERGYLSAWQISRLYLLIDRYRIDTRELNSLSKQVDELLLRVDVLPPSMVLSQAVIESAWGTSRFAREANNFFGQWCFQRGCGVVPARRAKGARHEVALFASPSDAVIAYYLNINRHPAYAGLRKLRADLRRLQRPLSGHRLVAGLHSYSARGQAYIRELRAIIRGNGLAKYDVPFLLLTENP